MTSLPHARPPAQLDHIEPRLWAQLSRDHQPDDRADAGLSTTHDRALLWLPATDAEPVTLADILFGDMAARRARRAGEHR